MIPTVSSYIPLGYSKPRVRFTAREGSGGSTREVPGQQSNRTILALMALLAGAFGGLLYTGVRAVKNADYRTDTQQALITLPEIRDQYQNTATRQQALQWVQNNLATILVNVVLDMRIDRNPAIADAANGTF